MRPNQDELGSWTTIRCHFWTMRRRRYQILRSLGQYHIQIVNTQLLFHAHWCRCLVLHVNMPNSCPSYWFCLQSPTWKKDLFYNGNTQPMILGSYSTCLRFLCRCKATKHPSIAFWFDILKLHTKLGKQGMKMNIWILLVLVGIILIREKFLSQFTFIKKFKK